MRNKSKFISIILAVIFILLTFQTGLTAFADLVFDEVENPEAKNFLVLGDSIAEGFGVENSSEAAYGRIVANTNGYNYRNFAQVANDTNDLIDKINRYDFFKAGIEWADIINICIGSNNYLANPDVVKITVGALFGTNNKLLDEIADGIYKDYLIIYDLIRELNPDATIIMNNIYCAWKGLGHIPFNKAVVRINNKIEEFQKAHNDIIIFDAASVITHNTTLIADDCVHPNAKGNVELARAFLLLLKENNLGENTEPVIAVEGIDYNFYKESFGNFAGSLICVIVKILTINF